MKFSSALRLTLAITAASMIAAVEAQPEPGKKPGKDFAAQSAERIQKMKSELSLTDEQVESLVGVMKEQAEARRLLMSDSNLSKEDRRAKGKTLMETTKEKVEAILTPEQRSKWEAVRKSREGKGPKGDKSSSDKKTSGE